jgi:site-specific recombinase XerD
MAKPPVVEPKEIDVAARIARASGANGLRNAALLYTLFASALTPAEIGRLVVHDYCGADGKIRRKCIVRAEVSYNGYPRDLYWSNAKLTTAIDEYLAWRIENTVGLGTPDRYRGLDPHSPLFTKGMTNEPFSTTAYTKDGVQRESAMVLSALFKKLLKQAGVEGSALSGRRTFAVLLGRQGKDPAVVREMMGLRNISDAKAIMAHDPVRMADIVARVF